MHVIDFSDLGQLLDAVASRGYALIGPTVRDGAIVYDTIRTVGDLPRGYGDAQGPSTYSLHTRDDGALFGYVVGPVSWKKFLFPPRVTLFSATMSGKGFSVQPGGDAEQRPMLALIGVRACELNAIFIQDTVFMKGDFVDPTYRALREKTFIVAVNCTVTAGNCFCASMGTGPKAERGFDLALTEVIDGARHYFLAETGSNAGAVVLDAIRHAPASPDEKERGEAAVLAASSSLTKQMMREGLREALKENLDHPHWDEVARRCLACANCTMVCPTCFCSTVDDVTDLTGSRAERRRRWDSCFTMEFTRVAGGNMRPSTRARYRQWLTHKLSNWVDQFATMGCVGCGRCITWCPAGIDITAEVDAIRGNAVQAQ